MASWAKLLVKEWVDLPNEMLSLFIFLSLVKEWVDLPNFEELSVREFFKMLCIIVSL